VLVYVATVIGSFAILPRLTDLSWSLGFLALKSTERTKTLTALIGKDYDNRPTG